MSYSLLFSKMKSTKYQLAKAHQNIYHDGVKKTTIGYNVNSVTENTKYRTTWNSCSCLGYAYRGHCSHISALRVLANTGGLSSV